MKTIRTLVLFAIALCVLGSCVFKGTATLWIYNKLTEPQEITSLYVYPTGSPNTDNLISSPLAHDEREIQYFVEPGDTTIRAIIDSGAKTATKTMTVNEGSLYPTVWITDSDID